jgi:metallophosphoesterase (TIGR03767 family)
MGRRRFLALAGASAVVPWAPGLWTPARAAAARLTARRAQVTVGTTLEGTLERVEGDGYQQLREAGPWPFVVRDDLAPLADDRDRRRRPVATIVQLTDIHLVDAQSPGRVEFLDPLGAPFTAAFRPHETLTTHVHAAMAVQLNTLAVGPVTGRAFDCVVSTGDNIDNCQQNELSWFITGMEGGEVEPGSGQPGVYEGVQALAWEDPDFWHPDLEHDPSGIPARPGLLEAAIASFQTPGVNTPWYSTYGNHDGLLQGNLPVVDGLDAVLTGDQKIVGVGDGSPLGFLNQLIADPTAFARDLDRGVYPTRQVPADRARRSVSTEDWVRAHLDADRGAGPVGHGFTEDHLDATHLGYRFDLAPGVTGIALDTGGYNSGSIGQEQLHWLEEELTSVHSRWFDAHDREQHSGADDQLVVLFSHFTIGTLTGSPPDPARPDERRYLGEEFVAFLQRWPNIVAWVNGHTHTHGIEPVPDRSGRTNGFWQITTASHVDWPSHSRVIEVVDHDDGTMSLFTTVVDHAGRPRPGSGEDPLTLASLSRELAANNDLEGNPTRLGPPEAHNTELGLRAPFDLRAAGIGQDAPAAAEAPADDGGDGGGVSTKRLLVGGAGVAIGAAAVVGGAVALRRRGHDADADAEADAEVDTEAPPSEPEPG